MQLELLRCPLAFGQSCYQEHPADWGTTAANGEGGGAGTALQKPFWCSAVPAWGGTVLLKVAEPGLGPLCNSIKVCLIPVVWLTIARDSLTLPKSTCLPAGLRPAMMWVLQQILYCATRFWIEQGALNWPVVAKAMLGCLGFARAEHWAAGQLSTLRAHAAEHRLKPAGAFQARGSMGAGPAVWPLRTDALWSREVFGAEGSLKLGKAGGRGGMQGRGRR